MDELRGRIADALAPEAADQVIATGPGYEVLDSDPDSVKRDSETAERGRPAGERSVGAIAPRSPDQANKKETVMTVNSRPDI